ncbi:alpha/beta hydrolase [Kitasatospora sp. NPDC096147]|uniref:alpha/beta hydrolase n=1 Tax=Kitasatospora sp. NPDC096147 TaxID=3364093 RepID=UPI003820A3C6
MPTRRTVLTLAGGGAAALLAVPAGPAAATTGRAAVTGPRTVRLTAPTGPRRVATRAVHLIDRQRTDPFAPVPAPRELMVQLWYAVGSVGGCPDAPYTSARVAAAVEAGLGLPAGLVGRLRGHAVSGAPGGGAGGGVGGGGVGGQPSGPLVLFSPGRTGIRAGATALAEELASRGFVVAAVDHTHDAAAVEFPDGRLVTGNLPAEPEDWDAQDRKEVAVRAADLRFVADRLARLLPGTAGRPVGVFGHSLGGAAAAEALRQDRRFAAGLDLDGGLFGSTVPAVGLDRPFLLLTSLADHETWQLFRDHHRSWGRQLRITGGGHLTATDIPHLAVPGRLAEVWDGPTYEALLGPIAPQRGTELVRAYTGAFFERFLLGRPGGLLDAPSGRYPEVIHQWSRNGG